MEHLNKQIKTKNTIKQIYRYSFAKLLAENKPIQDLNYYDIIFLLKPIVPKEYILKYMTEAEYDYHWNNINKYRDYYELQSQIRCIIEEIGKTKGIGSEKLKDYLEKKLVKSCKKTYLIFNSLYYLFCILVIQTDLSDLNVYNSEVLGAKWKRSFAKQITVHSEETNNIS